MCLIASWSFNSGNLRSNLQLLSTDEEPAAVGPTSGNFLGALISAVALDDSSNETIPLRGSTRKRKSSLRYPNNVNTSCQFALLVSDPFCFEEAVEQSWWKNVMVQQMQVTERNSTWELVYSSEKGTDWAQAGISKSVM